MTTHLRRYAKANDIEAFEFLRSVCEPERQSAATTAGILRMALDAGDAEALRAAFLLCDDRRQTIRFLLKQLKDQSLTPYALLEDALGVKATLPDRATVELLKLASERGDNPLALEALARSRDFRKLIPTLRAEFSGGEQERFLDSLAKDFYLTGDELDESFTPLLHLTQFRAVGVVRGIYTVATSDSVGELTTDSGAKIRTSHRPELGLKLDPLLNAVDFVTWRAYPKYDRRDDVLTLELSGVDTSPDPNRTNRFSVRGVVSQVSSSDSFAIVSVMPNEPWASDQGPTLVRVDGPISPNLTTWFCSITATLVGTRLQTVKVDQIIRMPWCDRL